MLAAALQLRLRPHPQPASLVAAQLLVAALVQLRRQRLAGWQGALFLAPACRFQLR